jgi:membrane protein
VELREGLNKIWHGPKLRQGWKSWLFSRFLAVALVLGTGFLLLASLISSATLSIMGQFFNEFLPAPTFFFQIADLSVSFTLLFICLSILYKSLPETRVAWREVWAGSAATSLLLWVGKSVIGLYLGTRGIGSSYGAAGSLVVLLLWVYYSAQLFYLGAELINVQKEWKGKASGASAGGHGDGGRL